jgi:hypothetical protein
VARNLERRKLTAKLRKMKLAEERILQRLASMPRCKPVISEAERARRSKVMKAMQARRAAKLNGGSMLNMLMDAWHAAVRNHYEAAE